MNDVLADSEPSAGPLVRSRFVVLLAGLLALFLGVALATLITPHTQVTAARAIFAALFVALLLASLNAVSQSRRSFCIGVVLIAPAIILCVLDVINHSDGISALRYGLTAAALAFTVASIVRFIFRPQVVNGNLICASLCGYLLIGILWANLYSLVDVLEPGSFQVSTAFAGLKPTMRFEGPEASFAVYYSYVTLTTLGYGDVVPRSPPARAIATLEAILGQIYLAVLVARLVGLHIAHQEHLGR